MNKYKISVMVEGGLSCEGKITESDLDKREYASQLAEKIENGTDLFAVETESGSVMLIPCKKILAYKIVSV